MGPEIGVASTKAFTGQVTVMAMLALAVGREKGTVTEEYYREVAKGLLELPAVLEDVLGLGDRIADLSKIFTYAHNFIYLGRGYNYPTALEGALKLKEISYIHAEGYPAAEMKHGAIALIDNEMPTVAIATPDNTYEKTASNIEEIRARGGKIIAVIARDDTHVRRSADYTIEVPVVTDCLMPIVVSVPLQLLAYYIAVNKGRNVDQPRNLAKSVTVECDGAVFHLGYNYPTALEGALKLKEISYIHAEGYPAAEMKHGAIALIDNEMPTVAIATPDNTYEKTASNIEEIRARGGKIIAVIARDDTHVRRSADYTIEVPVVTDCLMPIVVSVPLQLLAYYIAVNKGRNVDQPRNLAKSVTVE